MNMIEKSNACEASVRPELRKVAGYVREYADNHHGIRIVWTWGLRTEAEQRELFAQGRTKPGKVVTQAFSAISTPHGRGCALDFAVLDPNNRPTWSEGSGSLYQTVGLLAEVNGLEWGGRFPHPDSPHIQLKGWKAFSFPWNP